MMCVTLQALSEFRFGDERPLRLLLLRLPMQRFITLLNKSRGAYSYLWVGREIAKVAALNENVQESLPPRRSSSH